MRISTLALILAVSAGVIPAAAQAQAVERVWIVEQDGRLIAREVGRQKIEDGRWVLESRSEVKLIGGSLEQRTVVDAETLGFISYRMSAETPAGLQTIEADSGEGSVRFRVVAGGAAQAREAPAEAPVLCLDNLVLTPFEVLGHLAARRGAERFSFTMAVPQVMLALPATFEPGPVAEVAFAGRSRRVREGKLEVAGLLTRFWYDAADGTAYRVSVPAQKLEARIEGWPAVAEPPPSAALVPESVREIEVSFRSPLGDVPGVLTLPRSGGPFPAVVLLHGSGPQDRDETLGPNRPFRDLAHGLAARGIASLRYDKRTWLLNQELRKAQDAGTAPEGIQAIGAKADRMTLREEAIVDGIAALQYLAGRPEVRAGQRFVIGHSLGALAAPEVAREAGGVHGIVVMAGAGRPLDALIEEQLVNQAERAGLDREAAERKAREQVAPLRRAREGELGDGERIMGATGRYWKDLLSRDAAAGLRKLELPVLLLQGAQDIQVRVVDYERLRAALESRSGVPFEAKLFPKLNHLFMQVEGKSTGAEYYEAGTVDPEVVETIAQWIAKLVAPEKAEAISID